MTYDYSMGFELDKCECDEYVKKELTETQQEIDNYLISVRSAVHQTITIMTSRPVSDLINAIRARLEVDDTQISIYQIHPGSIQEKKMDPALLISEFFNQQPQAEFFHVSVYSR